MHVENSLFSTYSLKTMEKDTWGKKSFLNLPLKKPRFEIKAIKANRFGRRLGHTCQP